MGLSVVGIFLRRNDPLGRMAIGLAAGFPLLIIACSLFTSLLVPRYLLPMVPGIILLAVGAVGNNLRKAQFALPATSIIIVSVLLLISRPAYPRAFSSLAEEQLNLLKNLGVTRVQGAATHPHLERVLNYYIPRQLDFDPDLKSIFGPLDYSKVPKSDVFWLFDRRKGKGRL